MFLFWIWKREDKRRKRRRRRRTIETTKFLGFCLVEREKNGIEKKDENKAKERES